MRTFGTTTSLLLLIVSVLLPLSHNGVVAQFGIPKGDAATQQEATVGSDGAVDELSKEITELASKMMSVDADLKEQDAVDIAVLLDAAKNDQETKVMLHQMKVEQPEAFAGTANSSPLEILKGLEQAYHELKMLEVLFKDNERALREMDREGMIPPEKLSIYKKNPDLLEADTRKGLYFMFVALAEAGGYL